MDSQTVETWWVKIYIAGDLSVIKQVCREECMRDGLCVTVDPTTFIYTGGEEAGAVIGLIKYPRFPKENYEIHSRARDLALKLMSKACQNSVLVMTSQKTERILNNEM